MAGYRVRLVWSLPADDGVYRELGFLVHQLSMVTGRMVKELADAEGIVFEVEPPEALPGVPMDEEDWLALLEELASRARRVRVIVEKDGIPVISGDEDDEVVHHPFCQEYLEASGR